jgi:hypothetical protein
LMMPVDPCSAAAAAEKAIASKSDVVSQCRIIF